MSVDIGPALRAAIIANTAISSKLSTWQGSPAVFTRLPIPEDATFPCIVIPFDSVNINQDFLISKINVTLRDVMVYGNVAAPGTPEDDTRVVDSISHALRQQFHRNRLALGNTSYHVIDITVNGPLVAPTETYASSEPNIVGRMVTLALRIQDGS